ncbi:PqqD family protein [Domibacillus mangrovi]|uniref:PqqD family protein n=1 Tax=Domibacillus mangrovi TaxID=1714354 RepID=A0A1Q5P308_9BACI|nr:PqqD family protein [Domibacillus mangrovi]OKL36578.1 hypothetical protein BLL40_07510 [Domibacillus mangrovi]
MTSYIRKEGYDTVELNDEWIILNSQEYTVTTLNEVGGYCWKLLHEKQTAKTIVQELKGEYDIDKESVQADIETFLSNLMQYGLIQYAH